MSHPSNYLRMYRKKSPLTQSDMGFLIGLKEISNISRYEKGQRQPTD
jgi:transcriptional regulator with XRE-family HTH domain